MAQQFFVPGEQRAEKVKQLFTIVARRYDLINDLQSFGLHRSWKRRVIQLAGPKAGEMALDVCCGNAGAYAYILESLKNYPAQKGVAARMRDFGLSDVRIINLLGGVMSINYGVKS